MPVKMIATEKHPRALAGTEINVSSSCVRFFKAKGWAVPAEEMQAVQERDNRAALEAEYERLSGGSANPRWKEDTLRRKIEEAKAESAGTYLRRDMRAED